MTEKPYDPECYKLAEHYLAREPDIDSAYTREELASEIQELVEAWLDEWRHALPGR